MESLHPYLVSACIFGPLLGVLALALIPRAETAQLKVAALVTMLVSFATSIVTYAAFDPSGPEFQLEYRTSWVEVLGIWYHVGVDGIAVTLMLLTGFLGPIVVLGGWNNAGERAKEFCINLLILQSAMMGCFAAMDVLAFYICWEAVLIPMYLLIGVFGSDNRIYASVKFFLFTMVGSVLMLIAMLFVYLKTGDGAARSFDFPVMLRTAASLPPSTQMWLFLAFALAFAVKVPMWPVHTWLPDAHTEAPAAGSMMLAGVMLKMGTFGFMRYAMPMFPNAAKIAAPWIAILAVIGIVYGALMSLSQRDMKRLVAYSSVSHLGFVMLGVAAMNPQATTGAVYQMVNHGISTGGLFMLVGALYERRHTRLLSEYGGLAKVAPMMAASFLVITFSSIALPGTNGFVGEFLILSGTFVSGISRGGTIFAQWPGAWAVLSSIGATGVILGAAYMLYMTQRVWFGPNTNPKNAHLEDLNTREAFAIVPLMIVAIAMGIYPQPFLDRINPATQRFSQRVSGGGVALADGSAPTRPMLLRKADGSPAMVPSLPLNRVLAKPGALPQP